MSIQLPPSFGPAQRPALADFLDALPRQIDLTADFLYMRWIGQHGRWTQRGREEIDVTPRLRWWWEQLQPALAQIDTVYGFFNDDYGSRLCRVRRCWEDELWPVQRPLQRPGAGVDLPDHCESRERISSVAPLIAPPASCARVGLAQQRRRAGGA